MSRNIDEAKTERNGAVSNAELARSARAIVKTAIDEKIR